MPPPNSMRAKTCMVTGATSGIGKATALALARAGATVILVCRDDSKGEAVAAELRAATGNAAIEPLTADLSSQRQIRALACCFSRKYDHLHVLVNNAGAMFPQRQESDDGMEMTLAVNHLAPFLLTNLLLDRLQAAGTARVVNVNSDAHAKGQIDFDDFQMRRHYPGGVGMRAYANAKLANLLTVYELARRLAGSGVSVNALHPGYVATNILPFERVTGPVRLLKPFWDIARHVILSPESGAATSVYLASSPEVANVTGRYFERCAAIVSSRTSRDRSLQARVWDVSEQLTRG